MVHIKDNLFLADKKFLMGKNSTTELIKNEIKLIIVCTENLETELMKNEDLFKFLNKEKISIDWMFNSEILLQETRFIREGTRSYKEKKDELRIKQLRESDLFRKIADSSDINILLVCKRMNKMSPVIYLLIENWRSSKSAEQLIGDIPGMIETEKTPANRLNVILDYYNILKSW